MSEEEETREIITLQLGNYSNYIGTHFFNLQNPETNSDPEVNHGVFWRQGLTPSRRRIWTPRALFFDLKSNYVSQRAVQLEETASKGSALEQVRETALWDGSVTIVDQRQGGSSRASADGGKGHGSKGGNTGAGTDATEPEVTAWVDYMEWKFDNNHENRFSVSNYSHNPTLGTLANFGQGLEIFRSMEESISESVRRYAEDCDYFQGFHLLVDELGGFGGVASGILEHISDEYDKKSTFCFGCNQPYAAGRDSEQYNHFLTRVINSSLVWNSFNSHSTVFSSIGLSDNLIKPDPKPIKFANINYDAKKPYESSYILASTLDTLTSPYRLREPRISLPEITSLLNGYEHKMALIGTSFPYLLPNDSTLFGTLNDDQGLIGKFQSLTPGVPLAFDKNLGNYFVPRGFRPSQVFRKDEIQKGRPDVNIQNAQRCVELYAQEAFSKSVNIVRESPAPLKFSRPFSTMLDQKVLGTLRSSITPNASPASVGRRVWETQTIASAHNSTAVGELLQSLLDVQSGRQAKNFLRGGSFVSANLGLEWDDYDESVNNLKTLRDSYLELSL